MRSFKIKIIKATFLYISNNGLCLSSTASTVNGCCTTIRICDMHYGLMFLSQVKYFQKKKKKDQFHAIKREYIINK